MTWEKLVAVFAAFLRALEPYAPALTAFLAGRKWQQADDDRATLDAIYEASKASADHRNDTFDERVQRLERRGRVRGVQR
jgi:hypothetical protein